jgi:hypothetical protein
MDNGTWSAPGPGPSPLTAGAAAAAAWRSGQLARRRTLTYLTLVVVVE